MLKLIEGFDQYQGQSGAQLLNSLASAGFVVSSGLAIAAGRKPNSFALELQVSPGQGGASWSSRNNTIKFDLHGVATNSNNRTVAVGDGGAATSSIDGIQWSPLVLPTNKNLTAIKCHSNTFIAVGEAGTILRSTDGQTWTARTAPNALANLRDVAWGNGKWVAVGSAAAAGAIFVSSDDGMTWQNVTSNSGPRGNSCVGFGGDTWIVGGVAGQLMTSPDALAWTERTSGVTGEIMDIAFFNGTWLAVVLRTVRRSIDGGVTWSTAADAVVPAGGLRTIAVSNGRWITGSDQGALMMSDDTSTWTAPAFTGSLNRAIYDINITTGANVGWYLVGAKQTGSTTATAMIFVSLAPPTTAKRTFNSSAQKVVIGFAHRATARGRIFSIEGLFNMDWPAGISILGATSASVPIRSTWYYYELVIDKAANTLTLYTNDTLDLTVALPPEAANMTSYVMSWMAENGAVALVDDVYLLDSTTGPGVALVDRLKPVSIPLRLPTADAEPLEWEPSTEGPHWSMVGILPPSDTSYIRSAVSGAQDMFTSDTALPPEAGTAAAPILAVGVIALAQKSDLDNRQLGLVIGAEGQQKEVVDTTLAITLEYSTAIFETDPADQPWTPESVAATPFGVAVRP